MNPLLPVGLFGLLGIFSRFSLDRLLQNVNSPLPASTFAINIVGSFLAGLIYVLGERSALSPSLQTGLLVGFCGGFTTFSAYALQTALMLEKGRIVPAIAYLTLSPILGLLAAFAPIFLARRI